jgi:putative nucleotidyltransferase with HDIG domain
MSKNINTEILLVEDDNTFRGVIAKNLIRHGFNVREAENGLVARTIFELNPERFHIVISDIRMPDLDGVQLLKHVRARGDTPFILMTGFSEILESQNAYDLGATAFLPKPLRTEDLLAAIDECMNPKGPKKQEEDPKLPPSPFCQISIDEFMTTTRLLSDIYVRLGENHFIKVAHEGEAVSIERLKTYRSANVTHLYVTSEDFRRYVHFNIRLAKAAIQASQIPKEKKVRVLRHAYEVMTEVCFSDHLDKPLFQSANQLVTETLKLVSEDDDILSLLVNLESQGQGVYAHSVAVSLFSTMVAQKFGWTSTQTLFKVALSALFHDVGKKEMDPQLLTKKRSRCTAEEIKLIESHPMRGRDILLEIPSIPPEVVQVVYQHHEKINATGYPLQLRGSSINAIARLVHVTDRFVNLVAPIAEDVPRFQPQEAVHQLQTVHADEIDKDFLRCLAQVCKAESAPPGAGKKSA